MNIQQLATAVHVTRTTIYRWIKAKRVQTCGTPRHQRIYVDTIPAKYRELAT